MVSEIFDLQVMLIDINNVNQDAESHKWVHHIFKKPHILHVLSPIFLEKSIGNGLTFVSGLQVMLINFDNVNQADSHK